MKEENGEEGEEAPAVPKIKVGVEADRHKLSSCIELCTTLLPYTL